MSSINNILFFIAVLLNITVAHELDPCAKFKTCGQCIGNTLQCVWCPDLNHSAARCASSLVVLKHSSNPWCLSPMNPQTQKPVITRNEEFRSIKSGNSTIQLKPQNISMKVRPGDDIEFKVHYRPAEDYPIDIYYLFDNSYTMEPHRKKLVQQARDMKKELEKRSNNVRFGAGSFVEKLAMPYANESLHKLNTFNNHVPLTGDIAKFVDIVEKVSYNPNYDDPESGLDGLMQVMVCDKEINWRPNARRMIIYLTDATYHSAGDGKIVGAYKPHDMKCHLEPTSKDKYISHEYGKKASLTYDYPSVSQISKIVREQQFSIFFTTLNKVSKEYQALAKRIQNAHYFELKEIDNRKKESGSNLVEFISVEYQKLVRTLIFDEEVPPYVKITLNPVCNQDSSCAIGYNTTMTINGKIKISRCPREDEPLIIKIWPSGLEESLNIETEVLCQCECEKEGNGEANSTKCSNNGTLQCGICKCNTNRYDEHCQCEGTSTEERDQQLCKASSNDTHACSGRVACLCGKCKCPPEYDGAHCQYRTDECPMFENKVCGNQGKCEKNTCKCFSGYTGADCACSTSTEMCIGANSQICSGHGKCTCGDCECTHFDKRNNLYTGKFCNLCDTCIEDRCKELEDYVVCNYDGKQSTCDKTFHIKNQRTIMIKNQTEVNGWVAGNKCVKELDDSSSIVFKYLDGNNSTLIWIQKEKELPVEINKWVAFGSAIGVILLIGILTLIAWKILVDVHDSREYKKFLEESTAEGFEVSENPLYSPPQISITNPAYTG